MDQRKISVIIPVYNEKSSLGPLYERLRGLYGQFPSTEILFIDDGSRDGSLGEIEKIAAHDSHIKVIAFTRNHGQTAAIRAGIDHATGDILVPIDSDLENDPLDIPLLIAKIGEGYDVVSGWRQNRWQGEFLTRKLPSVTANFLISWVTGVPLHDWGCTLKAYRREVIAGVPLYGEMHRFVPAYASWQGARIAEMPVNYQPRQFGKSNYGLSRTFRVLLDLFLIRFLAKYMNRPIHFFGGLGFILFLIGGLAGFAAIILRLFFGLHFVETPLPVVTALFLIMGMNLIMMGILSEMQMRTYWETKGEKPYLIKYTRNL